MSTAMQEVTEKLMKQDLTILKLNAKIAELEDTIAYLDNRSVVEIEVNAIKEMLESSELFFGANDDLVRSDILYYANNLTI